MIELIIMAGVVYWYFQAARRNGHNGFLWGVIGALSYYVPVVLMGLLIAPLVIWTTLRPAPEDIGVYQVLSGVIGVITGILCCVLLKRAVARRWGRE